jgi:hypothetical protein
LTVHIFVGPTLAGQDVAHILPGAVVHPPIEHGDLLRLSLVPGDTVVIIDGYYHQRAPVRHKEILAVLADGITVVGCASMGALRAAELDRYGMIGNGSVYDMYRDGVLDADDEVALAHTPAPEYRGLTVPSVVVRQVVGTAVRSGVLDEAEATAIIAAARATHYTDRSWRVIWRALEATDLLAPAGTALRKFVESHPETKDIKVADALDTLRRVADGKLRSDPELIEPWISAEWRNRHLDEWLAEFAVSMVDEIAVGHSALIRYQQLYLDHFSTRWERFALGRIAGGDGTAGELATRALATAAQRGLDADSVRDVRCRHWLTDQERAELSAEAALVRVLVRSYRPQRPTLDLIEDQPDLVSDGSALRTVAEATVVNAEVASWGGTRTISHLKLSALRRHLAEVWRIDDTDQALLAAARDRGFESVDEAVDAARQFFLHKSFLGIAVTR